MGIKLLAHFLETGFGISRIVPRILLLGQKGPVLIGTGYDAVPAPDALVGIDRYDTVRPFVAGFSGAYVNTGRLFALVAPHREGAHVNYSSLIGLAGDQFHPGDPQRKKMLDSASSDAAMAAHTLHKVNNHSPSHRLFSIPSWLSKSRMRASSSSA
jgi:hypothetical protein